MNENAAGLVGAGWYTYKEVHSPRASEASSSRSRAIRVSANFCHKMSRENYTHLHLLGLLIPLIGSLFEGDDWIKDQEWNWTPIDEWAHEWAH